MVGTLQPLAKEFKITNDDGTPTDYFIRWAQQRQIDISGGITATQAQQLINDWATQRDVNAGTGLAGGGNLSTDVTLSYAGGISNQSDVDLTTPQTNGQVLVWDSASSKWKPANQSGGGGGGGSLSYWVAHATGTGASQNVTLPYSIASPEVIDVYVNGVHYETTEYSVSGATLTLTTNASGDTIEVRGEILSGGGGGGGITLISTVTVVTAQPTISFTSIPGTYKHLQIVAIQGSVANNSGNTDRLRARFNGDTTSGNYGFTQAATYGSGSGFGSADGICYVPSSGTSGVPLGSCTIDIPDYAGSEFKHLIGRAATVQANVGMCQSSGAGYWKNTAAITSIDFTINAGFNFKAGTTFWLYGIS